MLCVVFIGNCLQEEVKKLVEQKITLGVAKLRFLPRTGGVRPIENMGSHLNLPFLQVSIECIGAM